MKTALHFYRTFIKTLQKRLGQFREQVNIVADYTNWMKRCVYRNGEGEEPVLYQGMGPGNTSFIFYGVSGLDETELADCFARHGGKYGQRVEWMYQKRGQVLVSKFQSGVDENTLVLEGIGAGADDVRFDDGDLMEIVVKSAKLQSVIDILDLEDIPLVWAGNILVPRDLVPVHDDETITQILSFLDEMTANPGIVNLTADFWILDEKLERFV